MTFDSDRLLFRVLLFGLLGAGFWVLVPLWPALPWAAVLTFAGWPLVRMLTHLLDDRESLAADLLTLGQIALVALPLARLGSSLADDVRSLMELLKSLQVEGLPPLSSQMAGAPLIGDRLIGWWDSTDQQDVVFFYVLGPYVDEVGNWLLTRSVKIGGGTLELILSLIPILFFYRGRPRLEPIVHRVLGRLTDNRVEHYRNPVASTVQRAVNRVIGTAAAQALPAQIDFTIADVPGAILLDLLTFTCSLLMVPPLI